MNFFLLNLANLHHVLRICMIFFLFVSIILQNKIFYNFRHLSFILQEVISFPLVQVPYTLSLPYVLILERTCKSVA